MVKHVQIRIEAADHKQFRILCAKRGCSLQELLKNVILDYMANSPELQSCGKEVEYGTH